MPAWKPASNLLNTVPSWPLLVLTGALIIQAQYALAEKVTVYKKVMPDGSISYSDTPEKDAKALEIEPISTVPALLKQTAIVITPKQKKASKPYRQLSFASPENSSSLWANDGNVPVAIKLSPALLAGHKVEWYFDGKLLGTSAAQTYLLKNVDRGTHKLKAKVVNSADTTLIEAESTFTIHRPIAR